MKTTASILFAAALMLSSAQADGVRSTNCISNYGPFSFHAYGIDTTSCVTRWQKWDPPAPRVPTEQELAEARERERLWTERCRPAIRPDEFGVRRYVYAAAGCEFGKFQ